MLWLRTFIYTLPLAVIGFFVLAFFVVKGGVAPTENVITMGAIGEPENLNPIRATTAAASDVTDLVFNGLVRADEDLTLIGDLAEACTLGQTSTLYFDAESDAEAVLAAARSAGEHISLVDSTRSGTTVTLTFQGKRDLFDHDSPTPDAGSFAGAGTGYQEAIAEVLASHAPRDFWLITLRPGPGATQLADGTTITPDAIETHARDAIAKAGIDARIVQNYTVLGTTVELAGHGPRGPVKNLFDTMFPTLERQDHPPIQVEYAWFLARDMPSYTFRIRKGVMWQDGELDGTKYPPTEFTAHDAKFTYDRLVDPKVASRRSPDFVLVDRVEVPDDYTFRVTYKKPYSSALISWAMSMLPKHILDGRDMDWWSEHFDRSPLGTGPFRFDAWQQAERMRLTANPDYFRGTPNVEAIYFRYIPDKLNIKLALETGEIDFFSLEPYEVDRFRKNPKFRLIQFVGRSYDYIGWNLEKPLFQDVRVRRALAHGVNIDRYIHDMLNDMAIQSTGIYAPQFWFANPNIKPYAYDPDKARALLAEAGWKDTDGDGVLDKDGKPFQFNLITNQGNDRRKNISVLVQDDLKQIGIDVKLTQYEWTVFIEKHVDPRNFDAVVLGWSLGIDYDMYQLWHSSQADEGLNHCGYRNPEADRLIEKIRTTYDREKLQEMTWRLQEIIYEDQPYLWLTVPKVVVAIHADKFRVYRPDGKGRRIEEPIREVKAGFTLYMPYWYRSDHPPAALAP